jgi:hypothetical protein
VARTTDRLVTLEQQARRLLRELRSHRAIVLGVVVVLTLLVMGSWTMRLLASPLRHAGPAVDLGAYGLSGVTVRIIHPTRLDATHIGREAAPVTVLAWAQSEEAVRPFELVFPLPDEALAYVDADGRHVAGRLQVLPGYPEVLPYDLRVAHGRTQYRAGLLFPYRVRIQPLVRFDGQTAPLPEAAFSIRLISRWEQGLRQFAESFSAAITPYLLVALVLLAAAWAWQRVNRRRQRARAKELAALYLRLREDIKLDRWADARDALEKIRTISPHYRDIDHLDTVVNAAETASWRREQLYAVGVDAYKARNWPDAVHAFQAIEAEAPYYREVRFLRRTAALYADLQSRDRSLRLRAAQELGHVADLLDMMPLLHALGDGSKEVADAVEVSFRYIGLDAFETLLAGLIYDAQSAGDSERAARVRERAYRLLEGMGQAIREPLLGALHSSDPRITASAASLLVTLGARQKVADALLWVAPPHCEGILNALLSEGIAATAPLVQTLLKASRDQEQMLVNGLVRLKADHNIERHITEVMRSTEDKDKAAVLRRILDAPTPEAGAVDESRALTTNDSRSTDAARRGEIESADGRRVNAGHREHRGIWPLRLRDKS